MKKSRRKFVIFLTMLVICCVSIIPVNASSTNILTTEDVSKIIDEYLKDKDKNIEKGTVEYVDFLIDIMMNETTHELSNSENSNAIKEYAIAYITASQYEAIDNETGKFEAIPTQIKGKSIATLAEDRIVRENYDQLISQQTFTNTIQPYSTYSKSKAVAYAKKYATKRNANFPKFGSNCTNFVSQAVNAGGKSMTAPSNLSSKPQANVTSKYWYNKWVDVGAGISYRKEPRYSTGWTGVVDFHGYWKSKGATVKNYSTMSSLQNSAQLGDIVQLRSSKGWYHSIIITSGSKGKWKYCANTKDRPDYPLSEATASSYRIIRIK